MKDIDELKNRVKELNLDNSSLIIRLLEETEARQNVEKKPKVSNDKTEERHDIADRARELQEDEVRDECFMEVRESGIFQNRGFFLSGENKWKIVRDDEGCYCLVAK